MSKTIPPGVRHSILKRIAARGRSALIFALLLASILSPLSARVGSQVAPPANDDFANAAAVAGEPFTLNADFGAATLEDFESPLGLSKTAWWTWDAPKTGILLWNSEQSSNAVIVRFFGEDTFGLDLLASSYIRRAGLFGFSFDRKGSVPVQRGRRYFIQLDLSSGLPFVLPGSAPVSQPVSVQFEYLRETAPPNDSYSNSFNLQSPIATFTADLAAATAEPDEPEVSDAALQRTLWWTWQAPGYGSVLIRRVATNSQPFSSPVVTIFAPGTFRAFTQIATSATEYGNDCERHWAARDFVSWDAIAGTEYSIQVDRFPAFSDTSATFQLVFTAAPSNDIPESATILTGTNLSLTISNRGATGGRGEFPGAVQSGASSVWFKWRAPSQGILQLTKDIPVRYDEPGQEPTDETGVIVVTPGPPCGAPFQDLYPLPQFAPVFRLFQGEPMPNTVLANLVGTNSVTWEANGESYWIQMDGVAGTEGETPMNLLFTPPPSNDRFTDRLRLESRSIRAYGRTYAATPFASDSRIEALFAEPNQTLSRSAWWEWQAPATGRWTLFLSRGRDANRLVLYPEAGPAAPNYIATTTANPIVFDAAKGQIFQIAAFARNEFGTSVEFTITPVAAPPLQFARLTRAYSDSRFVTLLTPDNSGLPFTIERSLDMLQWTPLVTVTNAFSTGYEFAVSAYASAGFFRTRLE